jgi:hypothetical protein
MDDVDIMDAFPLRCTIPLGADRGHWPNHLGLGAQLAGRRQMTWIDIIAAVALGRVLIALYSGLVEL